MLWRFVMVVMAMLGWAGASQSRELAALPPGLIDRIETAAPKLLEGAGALILGYGTDGQIDATGIETAIAHIRAQRRAAALARLLEADLDGDEAVTSSELGIALRAASPVAQSRMTLIHDRADADGDGTLTPAEVRSGAEVQARRSYSDKSAFRLRDLLAMDMDRDGWVGLDEIAATIAQQLEGARLSSEGSPPSQPLPGPPVSLIRADRL